MMSTSRQSLLLALKKLYSFVLIFVFTLGLLQPALAQDTAPGTLPAQPALDSATPVVLPVPQSTAVEFAPGVLLLRFEANRAAAPVDSLDALTQAGAEYLDTLQGLPVERWQVPAGRELELAAQFSALPGVLYAEPDHIYHIVDEDLYPNDAYYSYQWAHTVTSAGSGWEITTGSASSIIAVLDTGIYFAHPDFAGKVLTSLDRDYVNDDNSPDDDHGHGTHVAGIAAGIGNNAVYIAGVDWNARILPLKVCNALGSCNVTYMAQAVTYACSNGARVINISIAGTTPNDTFQTAINTAYSAGCLIVAAMGNENTSTAYYPAAYDNVLAVAATTPEDTRAWYSNYGAHVDIAAPGGAITDYDGDPTPDAFRGILSTYHLTPYYGFMQGTSMASPYVAGLASLVWGLQPAYTNAEVENLLETNADDLGTPGFDNYFGWGRVDVARSLAAIFPLSAPDLTSPVNSDLDGNYLVDWSTVADATTYTLQEDDNGAFSTPLVRYQGPLTDFAVSGQAPGTWYYRVQAANDVAVSAWSNIQSVNVAPQAPLLNAISNPSGSHTYSVTWNSVVGALAYYLEEDDNSTFTSPAVRYSGPNLSYNVTFQPDGPWYYRVRAEGTAAFGPYSNVVSTTVNPYVLATPLISPVLNHGSGSFVVDWSDVPGAEHYELQESSDAGFTSPTSLVVDAPSSQASRNKPIGTWYYRVRAYSDGGSASAWSLVVEVNVGVYIRLPIVARNFTPTIALPYFEGFESGSVPPPDWSLIQTNPATWVLEDADFRTGAFAASVYYDEGLNLQDEILLSPYFEAAAAQLSFYSAGSLAWCGGAPEDNCDLKVWLVLDGWGGGDDILLGKGDDSWVTEYEYAQTTFDLTPHLVDDHLMRIAFEYVGLDGDWVGLDDISITSP